MSENPYQPPEETEGTSVDESQLSFAELIQRARQKRLRWARRCWMIGFGLVVAGVATGMLSRWVPAGPILQSTRALLVILSAVWVGTGLLVITFGPISYFWLRGRSRTK